MPKMMQNRMCAPGKSRRGIGGVLRELFTYSNKLKVPSVAAFCFAVAGAVLTIIGPSLLSRITDLISDALDGEIDLAAIGRTGVILLVIAFLVSPLGLPMAAAWLVGKVQDLRYAIQDAVYG